MSVTLTASEEKLVQKYAPSLLSAAVVILGGLSALKLSGLTLESASQFVALVLSTVGVYLAPLFAAKWAGLYKTGVEIIGVIVTAALAAVPSIASGHITLDQWVLVGVAVLKALATELGVQIRTDVPSTSSDVSADTAAATDPITFTIAATTAADATTVDSTVATTPETTTTDTPTAATETSGEATAPTDADATTVPDTTEDVPIEDPTPENDPTENLAA